ncbi:hypothetical protein HYV43_03150 [Candidatus Micrarchaeota archaeon]|nr:hypothetical protein [Candidatus Micrarchaeota archaeon]
MARFFILLLVSFLLLGCTSTPSSSPSASPSASASPMVSPTEAAATAAVSADDLPVFSNDAAPRVTSTMARPSNPDRNQPFILDATAEDDLGVKAISWESTDSFSIQPQSASFDCGLQRTCSASFTFASSADGVKTIRVYATDSTGHESSRSSIEFAVRPFDYQAPTATPAATASGPSGPACANGVCDGGESYQSCPQDCSVSSAAGAACGDGACSSGEDAALCAADCTPIRPDCGNNVCDASESSSTCSADCPVASASVTPACTSNSACGYKQICRDGQCVTVKCTNDAHCGYGKRCSSNSCVRCRSGPYGPAC